MARLAQVVSLVAAAIMCLPVPALAAVCSITPGSSTFESDFDGDGREDLAIGAPAEDVGVTIDAGIVQIHSWEEGDNEHSDAVISQDTPGVAGRSEVLDRWGESRATGDFNGDGFCDLAIGGASEDDASGRVTLLYGSPRGLTTQGAQTFAQDTPGILGASEPGDRFGAALIAGHFGHGPEADLAIGVPGEDVGTTADAGQVNVLFGGSDGLRTARDEVIHQDSPGIQGTAEAFDRFGSVLSAGDLGKTRSFELIIGVPEEDIGGVEDAGAVQVVFGSTDGLSQTDAYLSQATAGIKGGPETAGFFGQAVAAGDFGKTFARDLAIGAPGATVGSTDDAGQVHVLYGSADGPTEYDQTFSSASPGADDFYGYRLAAGQWGRTQRSELAIGIPGLDTEGSTQAGMVSVYYGTPDGLTDSARTGMTRHRGGDETVNTDNDLLTSGGIAFADIDNDGYADLVVGSPLDEYADNAPADSGTVMIWRGGVFDGDGNDEDAYAWSQDASPFAGTAEMRDGWGEIGSNSVPNLESIS